MPRVLATATDSDKIKAEMKKLQGTWVGDTLEEDGVKKETSGGARLTINGETCFVMHDDKVLLTGTIKIDPTKDPMEMDLQPREESDESKTALAVYSWNGEDLKLCAGERFGGDRPTDFTTWDGDNRVLIVFKRQSP